MRNKTVNADASPSNLELASRDPASEPSPLLPFRNGLGRLWNITSVSTLKFCLARCIAKAVCLWYGWQSKLFDAMSTLELVEGSW